ncbi:hypothetical protein [uncultured Chryseobacterium sp.]|uniref:hypothetical protein n=1 Tax=uncultured Chryseobacterium sp. TaxID=259322 RepID=UPI0025ED29B4|nr:hypothetical protein [uncultured Chryseobacterium sp.]
MKKNSFENIRKTHEFLKTCDFMHVKYLELAEIPASKFPSLEGCQKFREFLTRWF